MKITRVVTEHLRVPLPKRGKVSLVEAHRPAGPDAVEVVLVRLETDAGLTGIGLTYLFGTGAKLVRQLLETELSPLVMGEWGHDTDRLFAKAESHFRNVGFAGLPSRAYAAIDVALWDLKAKSANVSLGHLLGGVRSESSYFLSEIVGTGWDPTDVAKLAKTALKQGAMGVRVEIGAADVQADADRVREVHDALGDEAWVGVSAGGRYDLNTALALAHFFEDQGVDWFEDPIAATDWAGYSRLASRLEMPLAIGTTFDRRDDFYRVIREGLARVVRPDVCRLGGITPVLKIAAVAEAYHVAVSPVRLPEIGAHLGCGLAGVSLADSVGWFKDLFTTSPKTESGKLSPSDGIGLGLTLNESTVNKLRVVS